MGETDTASKRMIPFVIDNDQHRLSDVLNALLADAMGVLGTKSREREG